jgi:V8-like Glu-specific endopeptidase
LFTFACLALAAASAGSARANIFGRDDREPSLSREYPWRCVGLIVAQFEDGVATGTGFLIGRNLVLTNAHLTVDEATGEVPSEIYFLANRVDGIASNAVHVNRIWRGTGAPQREPERDWAVLRLDSNLGDDLQWLELSPREVEEGYMVGYSGDYRDQETAAISPLTFRDGLWGVVRHDGDGTRGSSGSPLLADTADGPVVVALNFGELREEGEHSITVAAYDDSVANLALPVEAFYREVLQIIARENVLSLADFAQRARAQVAELDYDAAEATLTDLIELSPNNTWARLLRGYVRGAQGREDAAAQDYREAVERDPSALDFTLVRAAYCLSTGNYEEVVMLTSRVIAASGSHRFAYQMRAAAYQRMGEVELAQSDVRQLTAL